MSPNVVVCVSDSKLRSLLSLILADAGAIVVACADDEEVVRVTASRFCQVCVLSMGIAPDMGELIRALRQISADTRIVVLATRDEIEAVLPLYPLGLTETLLHPLNPKKVVSTLHRLLGLAPAAGSAVPFPGGGADSASSSLSVGSASPFVAPLAVGGGTQSPFPVSSTSAQALEALPRPLHLVVKSPAMQKAFADLWAARNDPVGVVVRGEPGSEFELAAREYQAMGGDPSGYLVVMSHDELNVEALATQVSLDRLKEGVPRTYFLPGIEKLSREQEKPLLEFLRRARRVRDREKPLRLVFAAEEFDDDGRAVDSVFLEELQFLLPAVVRLPPMRERKEDIADIARGVMLDLVALFPDCRVRAIHPSLMQWLIARPWPGNHREIMEVMRKAVLDCPNRELTPAHLGRLVSENADPEELAAARVLAAVAQASIPRAK